MVEPSNTIIPSHTNPYKTKSTSWRDPSNDRCGSGVRIGMMAASITGMLPAQSNRTDNQQLVGAARRVLGQRLPSLLLLCLRDRRDPTVRNGFIGFRCVVASPNFPSLWKCQNPCYHGIREYTEESPCASRPGPRVNRGQIHNRPAATGRRKSVRRPSPGTHDPHAIEMLRTVACNA